jgi:hypothetical protein|eukprot:31197-Pelagococcus_subviridis.AAC.48
MAATRRLRGSRARGLERAPLATATTRTIRRETKRANRPSSGRDRETARARRALARVTYVGAVGCELFTGAPHKI